MIPVWSNSQCVILEVYFFSTQHGIWDHRHYCRKRSLSAFQIFLKIFITPLFLSSKMSRLPKPSFTCILLLKQDRITLKHRLKIKAHLEQVIICRISEAAIRTHNSQGISGRDHFYINKWTKDSLKICGFFPLNLGHWQNLNYPRAWFWLHDLNSILCFSQLAKLTKANGIKGLS